MRVAIGSWTARRVGGVEDYLSILLGSLAAHKGVEVAFWHEVDTPADRDSVPLPPGVLSIDASGVGMDAAIAQLRSWRPDVIYVHGIQDPAAEMRILDIAPAVLFVHTYVGTCISGTKMVSYPAPRPCARTFGWQCLAHYLPRGCGGNSPVTMWNLYKMQAARLELLRRYDAILTHTDHMHDEMSRHGLKSTVVPYAVSVATQSSPVAPRSNDTCRLLFAGRMERLKGGQYLLEALPGIVAALERPVHVIFAGDGTEREAWEARARTVESSTPGLTIEFTGWISQLALATLMRQVDLLVMPSIWPEPFGGIGVVAGQHGIPAAAFAVGGIPQWLHDGVNGHLAPDSPPTAAGLIDAVVKCLVERDHYTTLSRGARDVAATFTMETHLPALLRVLEDVSHGRR